MNAPPSGLRRLSPVLALAALLLVAIAGCAMFGPETTLKQQMKALHACPEDEMRITNLGGSRYQVQGCGSTETFVCGQTDGWVCNQ